ncbi:lactonase family protein [Streptomyces platensis]|uniref:lactonase family protein n=1 Tax=Streptomyces platensis TaxID=58346 RepID=UPI002E80F7BD|nr:lactonase family protein [Streptomyces platensis]WTI55981.1 lactonase family protein [Streptomyces platensis]WUB78490.1 lactonase family protein [Streptomyces platensis]
MGTSVNGRRAYIGSFTTAGGLGITTAAVDPESGALTPLHSTDAVPNPSYLAPSPDGRYLYAVSETPDGAAAVFALTPRGPELLAPAVPVDGADPTHLTLADGRLVTANYSSGSVSTLPVRADGTLAGPATVLTHQGSGPRTDRQEGPHAHAVLPDPGGRWLLSVDLGTDSVRTCALGSGDGALTVHAEAVLRPGSGPRHLAFHPRGDRAYVVNELDPTVTVCRWDADRGVLTPLGETRLLPDGATTEGTFPSELVISRDGRFAWAANRGHDSLSVLSLGASGDTATLVTTVPCGGHWPRDLALHPDGRHLYAANERSGDVTWFTIDPATGIPARAGSVTAPAASCVVFA